MSEPRESSAKTPPVQPKSQSSSAESKAAPKAAPPPAAPSAPAPHPDDRRDFFSDAMREVLGPFAGILERKINPLLAALEALPTEVDQLTNVTLPSLERVL